MRFSRFAAKALLAMLSLFDAGLIWHFWKHGSPVEFIVKDAGPSVVSFSVKRIPPSVEDWVCLLILIAVHAVLISFLIMQARRKPLPKADANA
jgi:hypothetical protein